MEAFEFDRVDFDQQLAFDTSYENSVSFLTRMLFFGLALQLGQVMRLSMWFKHLDEILKILAYGCLSLTFNDNNLYWKFDGSIDFGSSKLA